MVGVGVGVGVGEGWGIGSGSSVGGCSGSSDVSSGIRDSSGSEAVSETVMIDSSCDTGASSTVFNHKTPRDHFKFFRNISCAAATPAPLSHLNPSSLKTSPVIASTSNISLSAMIFICATRKILPLR